MLLVTQLPKLPGVIKRHGQSRGPYGSWFSLRRQVLWVACAGKLQDVWVVTAWRNSKPWSCTRFQKKERYHIQGNVPGATYHYQSLIRVIRNTVKWQTAALFDQTDSGRNSLTILLSFWYRTNLLCLIINIDASPLRQEGNSRGKKPFQPAVSGGGRTKPWRQKERRRRRLSSLPWRGGGIVSTHVRQAQKVRLALKSVYSEKEIAENNL